MNIIQSHFILYVQDQKQSTQFYSRILQVEPTLNVPGMTEFQLSESCILGLMPESGIKRLLNGKIQDPAIGNGIPRAELYLRVDEPQAYHQRAIQAGAKELSPLELRNWGDIAAYSIDLDGHILVFAKENQTPPDKKNEDG